MGYELVGKVWDPPGFRDYVSTQDLDWAYGITMHHTAVPNHSQRPRGFTIQHIRNLESYYRNKLGWSSGPHLFIDDDQIFGMSSLQRRGVHARSFNSSRIGIEVLGDYDSASPTTGRGKACWEMAAQACAILLARMGKSASVINGHRDDPKTSKSCPGKKVDLDLFRAEVDELLTQDDREGSIDASSKEVTPAKSLSSEVEQIVEHIEWQLKKLRDLV